MNIKLGYLPLRATFIICLLWTSVICIVGYLKGPSLVWSEVVEVVETQSHFTLEAGLLVIAWLVGFLIILCIHDWD